MICPGSLTAIVGLNGCGKSTLLKTLAGFLPPVSGRLRWQGKRPVIGWLAQRHALESQFPLNVQDVVSQGAWPGVSLLRGLGAVSYTHLRAHETRHDLVCRLLLEKKKT